MKINKPYTVAIIFFFFNSVALPYGLTYTTLLTPFFYLYIVRKTNTEPIIPFLLLTSPFIVAHLINGVDFPAYAASLLNIICIYLFGVSLYLYLRSPNNLEGIFRRLIQINFVL